MGIQFPPITFRTLPTVLLFSIYLFIYFNCLFIFLLYYVLYSWYKVLSNLNLNLNFNSFLESLLI